MIYLAIKNLILLSNQTVWIMDTFLPQRTNTFIRISVNFKLTNFVFTLYNVCSVHRGNIISTSGDVQYIGGYHDECGGYHEYIGGCSVHRKEPWVHQGDIMSTSEDVQYIGGISWYMWGSNLIKSFQFLLKTPMYWTSPNVLMISPWCTHGMYPPMYSWYPPDILMVSLRCTEHPPIYSWYPPNVLMVFPRCTHGIPPMYWTHIIQGGIIGQGFVRIW